MKNLYFTLAKLEDFKEDVDKLFDVYELKVIQTDVRDYFSVLIYNKIGDVCGTLRVDGFNYIADEIGDVKSLMASSVLYTDFIPEGEREHFDEPNQVGECIETFRTTEDLENFLVEYLF